MQTRYQPLNFFASDCNCRRRDQNFSGGEQVERDFQRGLHADYRQRKFFAHSTHRHRCRRVARHDDCLRALRRQKFKRRVDQPQDFPPRFCAVRNVVFVRKEDEFFLRQNFHCVVQDAQSAHARIEKRKLQRRSLLKSLALKAAEQLTRPYKNH